MNLGEKIRMLREERSLTQPELADKMGIEQSYLSKLETGKSLPSNDVLQRLLDAFAVELPDLIDDLGQGARNQLRHLPDVAAHLRREKEQMLGNRRNWIMASALCIAIGAALFYGGRIHLFAPNFVYEYESFGVIFEGEPQRVFEEILTPEERSQRIDEHHIQTSDYRGKFFNVDVEGGSRTYHFRGDREIVPWQNKVAAALGVFLAVLGVTGMVVERKLARFG